MKVKNTRNCRTVARRLQLMPFVPSVSGVSIFLKRTVRTPWLHYSKPGLCVWTPVRDRRCQLVSSLRSEHLSKRKDMVKPQSTKVKKQSRREVINQLLASSKASLAVVALACLLYVLVMGLIARRIASISLPGHERILLTALAVLLPDFRYVLKTYLDAVTDLKRYKPPVFPFGNKKATSKHDVKKHQANKIQKVQVTSSSDSTEQIPGEESRATVLFSNFRHIVDAELAKANSIIAEKVSNVTRDMTRPLMETSNQIQQMTIGTDLTLRKNVLIAAITIFLSLLGYFASAAGEPGIGCVVVMIATLLPSAILAPRRHELLILVNDTRVVLSLLGTLASVLCLPTFFPLTASYFFFGACIGLVAVRAPLYGN